MYTYNPAHPRYADLDPEVIALYPYDPHTELPVWVNEKWMSTRNDSELKRGLPSASNFERAIVHAFMLASITNQRTLVSAFPWLWVTRDECMDVANKFWFGDTYDIVESRPEPDPDEYTDHKKAMQ